MTTKEQRPWRGTAKAVDGRKTIHPNPTTTPAPHQDSVGPVPILEKLLWGWDDLTALTGLSKRLLQREVSARRMPGPDVRICRRALWRPATITMWLESLAQQADRQGRRSGQ
jgi:hypothetical protein